MTDLEHFDTRAEIDELLGIEESPQQEARNRALPIPLDEAPAVLRRRPTRRVFHDPDRTEKAKTALPGLPAAGETWHCLMTGAYDGFDLVDAMLAHAWPAKIRELRLATLGFNSANARRLLAMLDAGTVHRATMLVSLYYEADPKEKDICYLLSQELPARGGWYVATRSHAKVIAAEFVDGRHFIIESSANLRSCKALEQFTITHDAALYRWHAEWMEQAKANDQRDREHD